jgi:hypothetical protein
LPYPDADALVRLSHNIGGTEQMYFADAYYWTYLDNTQAFENLGVWTPAATAAVTGRGPAPATPPALLLFYLCKHDD